MAKPRGNRDWLRQQAERRQKQSAEAKARAEVQTEQQAKDFVQKLVTELMQTRQRTARLAHAWADRCWRVHELMGLLRSEWERAEAAEARVRELEAQLSGTNGHAKKAVPRKTTGRSKQ